MLSVLRAIANFLAIIKCIIRKIVGFFGRDSFIGIFFQRGGGWAKNPPALVADTNQKQLGVINSGCGLILKQVLAGVGQRIEAVG